MSNTTHTWTTPEYSYDFTPADADMITVSSKSYEAVENFLSTIELAGTEDGTALPELVEWVDEDDEGDFTYFVEVSRATVSLFLDFDVRYYMGVPTP